MRECGTGTQDRTSARQHQRFPSKSLNPPGFGACVSFMRGRRRNVRLVRVILLVFFARLIAGRAPEYQDASQNKRRKTRGRDTDRSGHVGLGTRSGHFARRSGLSDTATSQGSGNE